MIWERTDVVEFPTTDGDTETERGEGRVLESSHRQILDLPTPSSEFLPPPLPEVRPAHYRHPEKQEERHPQRR